MPYQNAIEIQGVSKSFGNQVAVNQLDLSVPTDTIFGFIGPNGSGKTTTMRMILRIYDPDTGEIRVLGETGDNITSTSIGYLPEERGLYRRMTVQRVLRYFAKLKEIPDAEHEIRWWLEKLEAFDWSKKRIEQLSKGMAQKIQFIVAVMGKPPLIILDEPFSGLDPVNMEVLRDAVIELRESGSTIIFSTHDMDMAERLCDRVFMIYRGNKVLDDSLDGIRASHGTNRIRVRLRDGARPPSLRGVRDIFETNRLFEMELEDASKRDEVVTQLADLGGLEHFEMATPTLHDIFVRIARPKPEDLQVVSSS